MSDDGQVSRPESLSLAKVLRDFRGQPGDLGLALQHVADTARALFSADICTIFAVNPITRCFLPINPPPAGASVDQLPSSPVGSFASPTFDQAFAASGDARLTPEGTTGINQPDSEHGLASEILKSGAVGVYDVAALNYRGRFIEFQGIKSFAGVALKTRWAHKTIAVLYVSYRRPYNFPEQEQVQLQRFASIAAEMLENTWLARRYLRLNQIGWQLNQASLTIHQLFMQLTASSGGILDISENFVLAIDHPDARVIDYYIWEKERFTLKAGESWDEGGTTWVLANNQPIVIDDFSRQLAAGEIPIRPRLIAGTELTAQSAIYVPLSMHGRAIGVLSIQNTAANAFDLIDYTLLLSLANYVALALGSIKDEQLRRALQEQTEAGYLLTRELTAPDLLEKMCAQICAVTHSDVVILYPYNPETGQFSLPAITSPNPGLVRDPSRPPDENSGDITYLMLNSPEAIFADHSQELYEKLLGGKHASHSGNFVEREGIASTAALPLLVESEKVGALFINYRTRRYFDEAQKSIIRSLATYAAIGLRNWLKFRSRSEQMRSERALVGEIQEAIGTSLNLDTMLNSILELVQRQLHPDKCSIMLYNPLTNRLETRATRGSDAEPRLKLSLSLNESEMPQIGSGLTVRLFKRRERYQYIMDIRSEELGLSYASPVGVDVSTRSELDALLFDKREPIGVINCESDRVAGFGEGYNIGFLVTVAEQTSAAVRNSMRLQELHDMSREIIHQPDNPDAVVEHVLTSSLSLIRTATTADLHIYEDGQLVSSYFLTATHNREVIDRGKLVPGDPRFEKLQLGIVDWVARTAELERETARSGVAKRATYLTEHDAQEDPLYRGGPDVHSEVAVQLDFSDRRLVGVLNLESEQYNAFDSNDLELLSILANQAVIAIQNSRYFQRTKLLYEASKVFAAIADPSMIKSAYKALAELVERNFASHVAIQTFDLIEGLWQLQYPVPISVETAPTYGEMNWMMAEECFSQPSESTCRTIVIDDVNADADFRSMLQLINPAARSFVVTPIRFEHSYYGNVALSQAGANYFAGLDHDLLEGLTLQLAMTLHRLSIVKARSEAEQRAAEAEVMSSLGRLAAVIPHTIGNGLGQVENHLRTARERLAEIGADEELSRSLNALRDAVAPVIKLTRSIQNKMLNLRRGRPVLRTHIPATRLLDQARIYAQERLSEEPAGPGRVEVRVTMPELAPIVFVDPGDVARILRELIDNALRVMHGREEAVLTLALRNLGQSVAFEVEDTGPGIPRERWQEIFGLFYSGGSGGMFGFGLYNAKMDALANGGDLYVRQSEPGHTVMRLVLPAPAIAEGSFDDAS
jgi:GAF domain-containing protein